jgi:cell division protein FtsB
MPLEKTTLVIRTQRTWLRRLFLGGGLVFLAISIYLVYEFGRFDGGYDRLSVSQQRREYEVQIERLEKANAELRASLADLQTGRVSQEKEREELGRTVRELQTQLARQSQDLAFYRGIVSSTVGSPTIKVQKFQVLRGSGPRQYKVRLVLVQAARPDQVVAGTVAMTLEGTEKGRPVTYNLTRLTADGRAQVPFSFRYFQDVDQDLVLPEGFEPSRVSIEVRASGRAASPLSQSFNWSLQPT